MDVLDSSSWRALLHFVDELREVSNRSLDHLEPWQIISYTLSLVLFTQWARRVIKYEENISFMRMVRLIFGFRKSIGK